MLKNAENIALQNLPILYSFVLQAEICTTFGVRVVQIYACRMYTKMANFAWLYFPHFSTFRDQFCTFTIFDMIFSAVVMDFVFHVLKKI